MGRMKEPNYLDCNGLTELKKLMESQNQLKLTKSSKI